MKSDVFAASTCFVETVWGWFCAASGQMSRQPSSAKTTCEDLPLLLVYHLKRSSKKALIETFFGACAANSIELFKILLAYSCEEEEG